MRGSRTGTRTNPVFGRLTRKAEYDALDDAALTTEIVVSTFHNAIDDLEWSEALATEVIAEEDEYIAASRARQAEALAVIDRGAKLHGNLKNLVA
jgi:hypothetical protein